MIKWLLNIGTINLSLIDTIHDAAAYFGDIIDGTFSGITERWDIAGNGLIAPNDMEFEVSNADGDYTTTNFQGKDCLVRLVIDGVVKRTYKFRISRAVSYYGKIKCYCDDFLQEYLTGDYPNTKRPKEIWSSSDADAIGSDDYCVPVVLGRAYIPVRSVNTGTERFYVLGKDISPGSYTIYQVRSPREWPNTSAWSSASYDMLGATSAGYQLLQPIIAASVPGGSVDSSGLWRSGDMFYDMLCQFERDDTKDLTNPAEWVNYLLKDYGVSTTDIDAASFAAAGSAYDSLTVGFDGGGWWIKEPREHLLSNLLSQTDSYLRQTDKIELHQFDKTPREIITNVLSLSYAPIRVIKTHSDSGAVAWPESFSRPQDVLNGKAVVPTHSGGTENQTSSDILDCRFLVGDSINAQKAGILYYQKKYEQKNKINLSVTFSVLVNQETLSPGQVITIDNPLYGGTTNAIITEMTINPDLKVDLTCVELNYLEDWGDLTTSTKDVITDTSHGFQLATTQYNGTMPSVDASWDTLLNIPQRFRDTASLGVNVTDSYLGYYDGLFFQSYIGANGQFQFRGDANNYINWNGSALNVVGNIIVRNPATVRAALNVAAGADNTITVINGGVVTTGLIRDVNSNLVIDFANAKFTVNSPDGLIVKSNGQLNFYDTNNVKSGTIYSEPGIFSFVGTSTAAIGGGSVNLVAKELYVHIRSKKRMDLTSEEGLIFMRGDVNPRSNNVYHNGDPSLRWASLNATAIYRAGTALDGFDDLYVLSKIQPLKRRTTKTKLDGEQDDVINPKINMPYIDPFSLPEALTNIDEVKSKLKKDNGDLISDEEIEELLNDYDEAGWMLSIDLGLFSDLTSGAVRQLDSDFQMMTEIAMSRITSLENKMLETAKEK